MNNKPALISNALPLVDVKIDPRAIVQCPDTGYENRRAQKCCPNCGHFKGIKRISYEGDWHQQYVIYCGRPLTRRTYIIDVIES